MQKLLLSQPTIFLLYGFPGSGKTFFARQLCEELQAAHVQGDRVRYELFDQPRYDRQENEIVRHIMDYMTEEFIQAGMSVVYDINAMRAIQRKSLRDLAIKYKAKSVLVWFQMDIDSAYDRVSSRDRRKADDKYTAELDREQFDAITQGMQNPTSIESYVVISGKRTFHTQRSAIIKKLYDMGLLQSEQTIAGIAKPNLVNLIPNNSGGRVDPSRRNITIR